MALRFAVKGVVALSATTLTFFSYTSFRNDAPSTMPHAAPPYATPNYSHLPWGCGTECLRIPATQTVPSLSATTIPALDFLDVNQTQNDDITYEPIDYFSLRYEELFDLEPTYDMAHVVLNLIQTAISGSDVGGRLPHWAPNYLSTFIFGILTYAIPHTTTPTASDLVLLIWCFAVSCLITLLNTCAFNREQRYDRELIELLQVQRTANNAELTEKDQLLADYRTECEVKDSKAKDDKEVLDRVKEEKEAVAVKLGECEKEIIELHQDLVNSAETGRNLESEKTVAMDDAKLAREQRESAQAMFSTQLEEKNTIISTLEAAEKVTSGRLSDVEIEKSAAVQQLKAKVDESESLRSANSQLQQRVENLEARDQQAVSLLTDKDTDIANLRTRLEAEQTRVANLEVAVLENVEAVKVIKGEKESAVQELSEVKQAFTLSQDALRAAEESVQLLTVEKDSVITNKKHAEEENARLVAEIEKGIGQLEEERKAQKADLAQLVAQQEQHVQNMIEAQQTIVKDLERTHSEVVQRLEEEIKAANVTVEELQCRVLEYNRDEIIRPTGSSFATPPITPVSARVIDLRQPLEYSPPTETSSITPTSTAPEPAPTTPLTETTVALCPSESEPIPVTPSPKPQGLMASIWAPNPQEENPITSDAIESAPTVPGAKATLSYSCPAMTPPALEVSIPDTVADVSPVINPTTPAISPASETHLPESRGLMASIWAPKDREGELSANQARTTLPSQVSRDQSSSFERGPSAPVRDPVNWMGFGTPSPSSSLAQAPDSKKSPRKTRPYGRSQGRKLVVEPSRESPTLQRPVSIGRLPGAEDEARGHTMDSELRSDLKVPSAPPVLAHGLRCSTTDQVQIKAQKVPELPKAVDAIAEGTGKLQASSDAWAEGGSLGAPISGVAPNWPQAQPQSSGGRSYRRLPQKSARPPAKLQGDGLPTTPPKPTPSSSGAAGPSQALLSHPPVRHLQAVPTPTAVAHTGPTGLGLRNSLEGYHTTFQPRSSPGTSRPSTSNISPFGASTSHLSTKPVHSPKIGKDIPPAGRDALIKYWTQKVAEDDKDEVEIDNKGQVEEVDHTDGGTDEEEEGDEEEDDEQTRRWRQRLGC